MHFTKPIAFLSLLLVLISCNNAADSPYPTITFEKKTPMPGIGRASSVAFVIDGKAYVTLGRNAEYTDSLKDCWQYDPNNDSWTKKASFPGIGRVNAMATVLNDTAYVGLGFRRNQGAYTGGVLTDFWMYDAKNDSWTRKADLPSKAANACVSFTYNNCVYVGSGFDNSYFSREFWKYIPSQNKWVALKDFEGAHRACAVACSNGEHIFFGTGYRTLSETDWWEYFPINDSWKKLKSMPDDGRENAVSLAINKRIFVATGRHFGGPETGGNVKSDILEYDIARNVWYERGNLPAEGRENSISFTINGKGYIGFGDNDTNVLNDFWSFQP